MKIKFIAAASVLLTLAACVSTSDPQGANASAWANYKSWHKVNPEPNTGDPTGFLGNVHEGLNAYRDIYVNSTGESTNRGNRGFPYPQGTIIVKESFANQTAYQNQSNPDLTIMIKLGRGASPETSDWEYVMGADGDNRGTGTSGLANFCHGCHTNAVDTDFSFINSVFYQNQ